MKIKTLKENQYYLVCIYADSSLWDDFEGEIGEPHSCLAEEEMTKDISATLSNYGLSLKDFESHHTTGLEKNRFVWSQIEQEDNKQFLTSYSIYISILTENKNIEVEK